MGDHSKTKEENVSELNGLLRSIIMGLQGTPSDANNWGDWKLHATTKSTGGGWGGSKDQTDLIAQLNAHLGVLGIQPVQKSTENEVPPPTDVISDWPFSFGSKNGMKLREDELTTHLKDEELDGLGEIASGPKNLQVKECWTPETVMAHMNSSSAQNASGGLGSALTRRAGTNNLLTWPRKPLEERLASGQQNMRYWWTSPKPVPDGGDTVSIVSSSTSSGDSGWDKKKEIKRGCLSPRIGPWTMFLFGILTGVLLTLFSLMLLEMDSEDQLLSIGPESSGLVAPQVEERYWESMYRNSTNRISELEKQLRIYKQMEAGKQNNQPRNTEKPKSKPQNGTINESQPSKMEKEMEHKVEVVGSNGIDEITRETTPPSTPKGPIPITPKTTISNSLQDSNSITVENTVTESSGGLAIEKISDISKSTTTNGPNVMTSTTKQNYYEGKNEKVTTPFPSVSQPENIKNTMSEETSQFITTDAPNNSTQGSGVSMEGEITTSQPNQTLGTSGGESLINGIGEDTSSLEDSTKTTATTESKFIPTQKPAIQQPENYNESHKSTSDFTQGMTTEATNSFHLNETTRTAELNVTLLDHRNPRGPDWSNDNIGTGTTPTTNTTSSPEKMLATSGPNESFTEGSTIPSDSIVVENTTPTINHGYGTKTPGIQNFTRGSEEMLETSGLNDSFTEVHTSSPSTRDNGVVEDTTPTINYGYGTKTPGIQNITRRPEETLKTFGPNDSSTVSSTSPPTNDDYVVEDTTPTINHGYGTKTPGIQNITRDPQEMLETSGPNESFEDSTTPLSGSSGAGEDKKRREAIDPENSNSENDPKSGDTFVTPKPKKKKKLSWFEKLVAAVKSYVKKINPFKDVVKQQDDGTLHIDIK